MAHLPHHLQRESVVLNEQLNDIKSQIQSLHKRVQKHQNETQTPILVAVTPSTPYTVTSINPYAMVNAVNNIKKTDTLNETESHLITTTPKSPFKSTQRLKTIHWKPIVSEKIAESIWSKIDQNWSDFDPKHFEQQFGATSETVRFLTPERRQQVRHGLDSLNMCNEEIRDIILTLDATKIDANAIKILIDIVPTTTEQEQALKLSKYKDIKYFAVEEKFFYCLNDIKELKTRLKHWLFTLEFNDKLKQLNEDITVVEKAKLAVCLSKDLRQLLSIVLSFGNYMNCGKYNQNCSGFQMSDIYLLSEIKTSDSMTFPMFLCEFLQQKHPQLINNIINQCRIVKVASQIGCRKIDDEYFSLLQNVSDLETMISEYKDKYFGISNVNDQFIPEMKLFQKIANNEMWKLKFRVDSYHKCQSNLIKYFAYDSIIDGKPIKIQKIFKDVYGFIEILEIAQNKLQKQEIENVRFLFSKTPGSARSTEPGTSLSHKIGEKSDPDIDNESDISNMTPTNIEPIMNFKRNRRNTETLRLELDVLELNKSKSEIAKTPSVIRHKSVETKMNRFISQTPQIGKSYASPYKNVATGIMRRKKQNTLQVNHNDKTTPTPVCSPNNFMEYKANELKNKNHQFSNTPMVSKSYVNPYQMIAMKNSNYQTTNLTEYSIIEE